MSEITWCIHGIMEGACAFCLSEGPTRPRAAAGVTADEPTGHRGHPSASEVERAVRLRPRLVAVLGELVAAGVQRPIPFLADLAQMVAAERSLETWGDGGTPTSTIRGVLDGRAAKHWSLEVLEQTLEAATDLLAAR